MKEIEDFQYKERGKDELNNKKHSHDRCYEMLQIWNGEGVIMLKNRLFSMKSNTLYFINGMDVHCSVPKDPASYVRSKIIISSDFINGIAAVTQCQEIIDDLFLKNGGTCLELSDDDTGLIDGEMLQIRDSLADTSLYTRTNIAAAVFRILTRAHRNKSSYSPTLANNISEVLLYINQNIERKITLDEISRHIHTGKYYLCHIFKETTQMTISDYILNRRISIAKKKLIFTDLPLSEIALSTGFSSFSYFSRVFRECEGMPPRDFRRLNAVSR